MRMHTIPQNVTAYEDKIVGMLVGRQFIYLAIAGVIIFVLLSTNVGPIFIRVFLSMVVGGFAAALALFKPNDRNFDGLMMSYVQAIFGPTEWVWRKDELPLDKLRLITDQLSGRPPVVDQSTASRKGGDGRDNLRRVSRFQTFIADRESGMDNEELEFIEQLNFSEPIPQKAFTTVNADEKAPPMLTKHNYAQLKVVPSPAPDVTPIRRLPKPLSAIAGSSAQTGVMINIEGRPQGVRLRNSARSNRSLSRQLLSSGVMTLPIRGELKFNPSDDFKQELQTLTAQAQPAKTAQQPPSTLLSGQPVAPVATTKTTLQATPAPVAVPTPAAASKPMLKEEEVKEVEQIRRFSDYDGSGTPSISQQIAMLSQALPNSGITKGNSMSDLPTPNTPLPNNSSNPPQSDPVTLVPNTPPPTTVTETDLEREARQVEAAAQKALSELEDATPTENPRPSISIPDQNPVAASTEPVSRSEYESEISRLKARSLEMEQKAKQAEDALHQLQQQLAGQPALNHPALGAQQELVNNLRQQQAQSEAYRQELEQKMTSGNDRTHLHAEYAPVPQVAPVLPDQADLLPPTPEPEPVAVPTPTPAIQPANPIPSPDTGELDLQAKMAAAGVGSADAMAAPGIATPTQPSANTATPQIAATLTSQPNIINGTVIDAQGQMVPGVIVVVKNAQGESKRALKTNKLGQFVVTTPLANGAYSVEVDKKGLSFDIMKVELTGAVLPPILIKSKSG